jgi:starch synthase
MEGVLQNRRNIVRGVENGINTNNWNPSTDTMIYASYDRDNLAGKLENKKELQKESGLIECDAPLFAVVSRLVPNKGLDLMLDAARDVLEAGGQFILLGSGEKYYENAFLDLLESYPGSVSINLEFNSEKAHKIYAGSDVFLMPSRYEPCGLSQLIAMRYGSIPLVHKTGGLADTVIDEAKNKGKGTGFAFNIYSSDALLNVIKITRRYYKNKADWSKLVYRAMSRDSSWESPANGYISLYNEAIQENLKRKSKGRKVRLAEKSKAIEKADQ